jgi:dihydropyrimidinase
MPDHDLVIAGGTLVTAADTMEADLAVRDGRIEAIGKNLGKAKRTIDAKRKLVLPGGVDTHAHIEQISGMGATNADSFESATKAAASGGTTSLICFAAQQRGQSLKTIVEAYHAKAKAGAVIDYAMHMILSDPTEKVLKEEVPALIAAGHGSLKIFMTYDNVYVDDGQVLDVLAAARAGGAMVCVHAENYGMITWISKRLIERGYTAPKYHGVSHPRGGEIEAFHRIIAFAELVDQPIMIFHVSTAEGAAVIREARGRGVKVWGETCPQYLFLTKEVMNKPGFEGAKWVFSPPAREPSDSVALWQALRLGDLQAISSDHAPYAFDKGGKFMNGPEPSFKQIPNGMPGLEWRMPLMMDAALKGTITLNELVRITATAPAQIYNLGPRKGSLAIGADADVVVWDPAKTRTLSDKDVLSRAGYNPWAGRTLTGWPATVLRRGEVIVDGDGAACTGKAGSGQFLARSGGEAAKPRGIPSGEFDPARNFGATLA